MNQLIGQLADSLSGATDLEALTRPLLELLEAVTGMESTYLTTIDEAAGVQNILYARNSSRMQIPEGLTVPWGDTLCKRALEENRPYTDDVAQCWGDSDAARALGIRTYLSQPVHTVDGGLFGTLCAASAQQVTVRPDAIKVLGMFARLIAFQVEREHLVASLRKANAELSSFALVDPLTGVANRRALVTELQRALARGHREGTGVSVAFVDLDGFKAINDVHGHDVGDRFLIHIAGKLSSSVRSGDFVARYGGDEFVVVTSRTESGPLQTRIEAMTRGAFVCGDVRIDYPGASVGVVSSANDDTDPATLLSRADAAMYQIKKARRTR